MGFYLHIERLLFLVSVCVYKFGHSSAQTNNRDPLDSGNEDNSQGSLHFFYKSSEYPRDCREVFDQCSSLKSSGVFLIKPDGYPEPFEVYCNNDVYSGNWTVIQRRLDGSLDFHRNWEDYKKGFGFLSSEFWIGNERLSFLTNQNIYELQIDMFLSNDASFHIKYNMFRISDEWGKFALARIGDYTGNSGSLITFCPQNTVYGNCTCQATCEDPLRTSGCQTSCDQVEACVCQEGFFINGENCVSPTECGCYVLEANRVLQNKEIYVNAACTEKCTCNGNQLNCDTNYGCSSNAACRMEGGVRQCYCNTGYTGDGETCTMDVPFTDCNDVRDAGNTQDGVYSILPTGWSGSAFNVFCNMTIDGGGWTVFQRRDRGATNFYKNWASYKNGFGHIQDEFWLGNDKLHYLTQQGTYELRVDFVTSSNSAKYAKYSSFRIDAEATKYRVTSISGFSGNGYNGMEDIIDEEFSTFDQDNDGYSYDCAEKHHGGWWYWDYYYYCYYSRCHLWYDGSYYINCAYANLNGDYNGGNGQNMYWTDYDYYYCGTSYYCNIKYTEMKIRRKS